MRLLNYVEILLRFICLKLTILSYLSFKIGVLFSILTIEWSLLIEIKIRNTILFLKALLRGLFGVLNFMCSFGEISSVIFP